VSGKSFVLSPEESIISYFCDGYAIKYTCDDIIKIGEINYKYEIIDRKGKVVYTIDIPKEGGLDNPIVLKEGVYSYENEGKCYIKTWK
jgi:hypothetical protein